MKQLNLFLVGSVLLAVVLFASACFHANSGVPKDWDDQINAEGKSLAQANFEQGCVPASSAQNINIANPERYCVCVYDGFKQLIDFKDFEAFNKKLLSDSEVLTTKSEVGTTDGDIAFIVQSCINSCRVGGNCKPPANLSNNKS